MAGRDSGPPRRAPTRPTKPGSSAGRLQTDHIDLYYAHFNDRATPLEETVAAFDDLVTAGKVRYVGVSNYSPERLRRWLDIAESSGAALSVALQPQYSPVHRRTYEPGLRDIAVRYGLGVMPYWALAAGFLTGKYRTPGDLTGKAREDQVAGYFGGAGLAVVDAVADIAHDHRSEISTIALAWLLTPPGIVAPIASASRPDQLLAQFAAATIELSDDEVSRLTKLSDAVGE
jgi:aryl-alcohol dehydrogenase-like predicted oxidoreductase